MIMNYMEISQLGDLEGNDIIFYFKSGPFYWEAPVELTLVRDTYLPLEPEENCFGIGTGYRVEGNLCLSYCKTRVSVGDVIEIDGVKYTVGNPSQQRRKEEIVDEASRQSSLRGQQPYQPQEEGVCRRTGPPRVTVDPERNPLDDIQTYIIEVYLEECGVGFF